MTDSLRTTDFGFGWRPDTPDMRDLAYSAPFDVLQTLPTETDLRGQTPPIVNQGHLGSCTANAIGSAHFFDQMKQGAANPFQPSRLFVYYNERRMEDAIASDAGALIRDGCKSISKEGVCPEALWPYDIAKFSDEPPKDCYDEALLHQSTQYMRIQQSLGQLKGCLADGYPFVFGFTVYASFESPEVAQTGVVPLPSNGEKVLGGHAGRDGDNGRRD